MSRKTTITDSPGRVIPARFQAPPTRGGSRRWGGRAPLGEPLVDRHGPVGPDADLVARLRPVGGGGAKAVDPAFQVTAEELGDPGHLGGIHLLEDRHERGPRREILLLLVGLGCLHRGEV